MPSDFNVNGNSEEPIRMHPPNQPQGQNNSQWTGSCLRLSKMEDEPPWLGKMTTKQRWMNGWTYQYGIASSITLFIVLNK